MKAARPARVAIAAALLAAAGCDYWDNLVEEPKPARADLEIRVVDAWTGQSLGDALCRDSLRNKELGGDGQGGFRLQGGATGLYAIRCGHEWYYDGAADVDLVKEGTRATVKLARRGLRNWYPEKNRMVAIPRAPGSLIRYPVDLDWKVTPADDSGRFRYEWSFSRATALSHGHREGNEPLDSASFSAWFKARADDGTVGAPGRDTVVLSVFSLLNGKQNPYLVGTDTFFFDWVRNRKPAIAFSHDNDNTTYRVGCKDEQRFAKPVLRWGDSDGHCDTVRVWAKGPSLKVDTLLSCGKDSNYFSIPVLPPSDGSHGSPLWNNGSETFENKLYAEITDDNGEKSRDSIPIRTFTNDPPTLTVQLAVRKGAYFAGDGIPFSVTASDTDGVIDHVNLQWRGYVTDTLIEDFHYPVTRDKHTIEYSVDFEPPVADTFLVVGTAIDNCGGIGYASWPIPVIEDTPPRIAFTKPVIDSIGDDKKVGFTLTVTDPDAIGDRDHLTLVRVSWAGFATEDTLLNAKTYFHHYERVLPSPATGDTLAIRIHAEDSHFRGKSDTLFRYP